MAGKVCVVTGGTSGIGGAISRGLAMRGATVVMVARDAEKGRSVAAAMKERKPASSHPQTYDQATAHRLWEACEALIVRPTA